MTQTVEQFLSIASKFLTDFDGNATNLQSFLDGLQTIELLKGEHEAIAVSLIKTKLKDSARQLITTEATISEIIETLKKSIKGESVGNLAAKLMNIQQKSKTANQYTQEVEKLAKAIQLAYISDGVPHEVASKYTTKIAVDAMVKNCSISEVKIIMKAGQFENLNAATQKFVEGCTDATGRSDSILFYRQNANRGNFRGNFRGNRGYQNRGNSQNRGNFRGRTRGYHNNNNNNRGRNTNYYPNQNRNFGTSNQIRQVNGSENVNEPLSQ